jgi:hypothetical protein
VLLAFVSVRLGKKLGDVATSLLLTWVFRGLVNAHDLNILEEAVSINFVRVVC